MKGDKTVSGVQRVTKPLLSIKVADWDVLWTVRL
jgi:hypothetical protein